MFCSNDWSKDLTWEYQPLAHSFQSHLEQVLAFVVSPEALEPFKTTPPEGTPTTPTF